MTLLAASIRKSPYILFILTSLNSIAFTNFWSFFRHMLERNALLWFLCSNIVYQLLLEHSSIALSLDFYQMQLVPWTVAKKIFI